MAVRSQTEDDWTRNEVETIVSDYLNMLTLDLGGQAYNKSAHRRALLALLQGRSEGAIEFKHCNISAALITLGFPYIRGYKPRGNYQQLLLDVLSERVQSFSRLDDVALAAVSQPASTPQHVEFAFVRTDPPPKQDKVRTTVAGSYKPVVRDYLEREAYNSSLGLAGEEFVIGFERWKLRSCGQSTLADRIEHTSRLRGDGLGYDVLSFTADGAPLFIEVKTTAFGRETPFYVSAPELQRSADAASSFRLYRVFGFRRTPRFFELAGKLDQHCFLDPVSFRASFVSS